MADKIIWADNAISAIQQDSKTRAKEESILWYTIGKFGRVVIVSRKKYSHMRLSWDLLVDIDGNQSRFSKLNPGQIKAYQTGNMKQNQKVWEDWSPEDMSELEVEVKAILKADHEKSQVIRENFNKVLEERKAKKAWNITVVAPTAPVVDDSKLKELEAQEKVNNSKESELKAREEALKAREEAMANGKEKAETPKTPETPKNK